MCGIVSIYGAEVWNFGCNIGITGGSACFDIVASDNDTTDELVQSLQHKLSSTNRSYNVASIVMYNHPNNTKIERFPREFFELCPSLRVLNINDTKIAEIVADDFVSANNLTKLDLDHALLSKLSARTFQMRGLERLSLRSNEIEIIDDFAFANLSSLIQLYLNGNKLTTISRNTFTGLFALKYLDLYDNNIGSIENGAFVDLKELGSLDLLRNKLKRISDQLLSRLTKLELFDVTDNQIETVGDSLYPLTSLRVLKLEGNPVKDINFVHLANLPRLWALYLSRTGLDLKTFGCICSNWSSTSPLQYLHLASNNVTSVASLEALRIFPNLRELDISGNDDLYVEKERLRSFLPKLEVLKANE